MPFHLHDTLRGHTIPLPMRTPGAASIYLCGPTVYNYIHIGNARPAIVFDVLVRHLLASGLAVTFVRNFTDVDDKIINAAIRNGESPAALAERFIAAYHEDMRALGCLRPDHEPRVSQFVPQIIAMIEKLIANGHAYERDGDVYFAVHTFPAYGKLGKQPLDDLRSGERVAVDERKTDALDFALWKRAKAHEPAGARWTSPWGEGRPGWHIECSAMAHEVLGDGFDLHGGGMDLIFPHHENEIAQSECASGHPFAMAWMHNGFINFNGDKISKSREKEYGDLAKYFVLRNVLDVADPEAVRYWTLGTHYRAPLNFELDEGGDEAHRRVVFPGLEEAERRVEYLYETRARLEARIAGSEANVSTPAVRTQMSELRRRFDEALDDDLNTANALAPLADAFKRANELCDRGKSGAGDARALAPVIAHMSEVLGVANGDAEAFAARVRARRVKARGIDPGEIDRLVRERDEARRNRDFARGDAIRIELGGRGIEVRDDPRGSVWKILA